MSQDQKKLKVASLLMLAWSLAVLVFDFIFIGSMGAVGWPVDGVVMIVIFSVLVLIAFWEGFRGIQGANTPSKANSLIAAALILSLYLVIVILIFVMAFADAGQQAIDGDMPLFIVMVIGLLLSLFSWAQGKKVFEASKDVI